MRIAICVPCHRDTKALFTQSLARMIAYSAGRAFSHKGGVSRPEIETLLYFSCDIATSRNELVKWAREWRADSILWMDDDHVFPPDTLVRLHAWNKPVVGVNSLRRGPGELTNSFNAQGMVWTAPGQTGLEQVAKTGLGICLMAMSALAGLEEPLFRSAPGAGEDYHLMAAFRAAGIGVFVDHGLSLEAGHIDYRIRRFGDPGQGG